MNGKNCESPRRFHGKFTEITTSDIKFLQKAIGNSKESVALEDNITKESIYITAINKSVRHPIKFVHFSELEDEALKVIEDWAKNL